MIFQKNGDFLKVADLWPSVRRFIVLSYESINCLEYGVQLVYGVPPVAYARLDRKKRSKAAKLPPPKRLLPHSPAAETSVPYIVC